MKIMYRAQGGIITKVSVQSETPLYVKVQGDEIRRLKISRDCGFFDTWDEAYQFIYGVQKEIVENLRKRLEIENGRLGQIKGMRKL